MADVEWIKIATSFPDNKKLKQIRKLPNGDTIALMWVYLMCLAGQVNENGLIYLTPKIPYTDEMLADEFRIDVNTIRLGLKAFVEYGLIEIVNDIICLSSWEKWQSTKKLSELKEYNKMAQRKSRAKKKALLEVNVNDMSMTCQPCQYTEEDKERDKERDKEGEEDKTAHEQIVDLFHTTCTSYRQITSLTDERKAELDARLGSYTFDDFKMLFEKAEASDFLKGNNRRNWKATFDWLIKEGSMEKVLEGNYDNEKNSKHPFPQREYDMNDLEKRLLGGDDND